MTRDTEATLKLRGQPIMKVSSECYQHIFKKIKFSEDAYEVEPYNWLIGYGVRIIEPTPWKISRTDAKNQLATVLDLHARLAQIFFENFCSRERMEAAAWLMTWQGPSRFLLSDLRHHIHLAPQAKVMETLAREQAYAVTTGHDASRHWAVAAELYAGRHLANTQKP